MAASGSKTQIAKLDSLWLTRAYRDVHGIGAGVKPVVSKAFTASVKKASEMRDLFKTLLRECDI